MCYLISPTNSFYPELVNPLRFFWASATGMCIATLNGTDKEPEVVVKIITKKYIVFSQAGFAPELHFSGRGFYGLRRRAIPLAASNIQNIKAKALDSRGDRHKMARAFRTDSCQSRSVYDGRFHSCGPWMPAQNS